MENPTKSIHGERHHTLDWIRTLATLAVFIFHSGAAYAIGNWHINNPEKSGVITILNGFLLFWIMPVLFVTSGASAYLAMRSRPLSQFVRDRFARLLVPLLFGILVIVPPQVYWERQSRAQFSGSFFDFYPHYFDGWYLAIGGSGNFAWMGLHLWYLLFLFVLTLIAQPVFSWMMHTNYRRERLERVLTKPGTVLLLAIPIVLVELAFGNVGLGGWNMLAYVIFFFLGYLLLALPNGVNLMRSNRLVALLIGIIASAVLMISLYHKDPIPFGMYDHGWQIVLHGIGGWSLIVAILGYGYEHLGFTNGFLRYANEAVLPFYILHQTFIVGFGFYVNGIMMNVGAKYAAVILLSLGAILGAYEILCRIEWLRFLFGMKARNKCAKP